MPLQLRQSVRPEPPHLWHGFVPLPPQEMQVSRSPFRMLVNVQPRPMQAVQPDFPAP